MQKKTHVNCVITAHSEGLILHTTLLCYEAMRVYAEKQGIDVSWVLVLDRADDETTRVAENHPAIRASDIILKADNGAPCKSRNDGLAACTGDIIAILDGDDYCTENFLYEAVEELRQDSRAVVHPQYIFNFGAVTGIQEILSQKEHPEQDIASLVFQHPFVVSVVAMKEVFQKYAYQELREGFGFEDWNWNCEVMGGGYSHVTARNTMLFYRRKAAGVLAAHSNCVVYPCAVFNQPLPRNVSNKETSPSARSHFKWENSLLRWKHSLFKKCPRKFRPLFGRDAFSAFWKQECRKIAKIDPMLHPSNFPHMLPLHRPRFHPEWGRSFIEVCSRCSQKKYDVVYLVPWLVPSGADLMTISHANSCAEHGKNILVITTELKAQSPWKSRLDASVDFLDLGAELAAIPKKLRVQYAARLLLQLAPRHIHCINSDLGHKCFTEYGKALSNMSHLYSTFFADEYHSDGIRSGYAARYLCDEYDFVQRFTCDNWIFPQNWCAMYGLDSKKFHVVYGAVDTGDAEQTEHAALPSGPVLWASRIGMEKRPDLLLETARLLPDVEFHVWGNVYSKDVEPLVARLKTLPNITLKGAFNGFFSLPLSQYSCFLYTSERDGLPNVLLEAASAGLPLIGSTVGGIADLLSEDTGWPVRSNTPEEFAERLRYVLEHPDEAATKAHNTSELIEKRHTKEAFWNSLSTLYFSKGN